MISNYWEVTNEDRRNEGWRTSGRKLKLESNVDCDYCKSKSILVDVRINWINFSVGFLSKVNFGFQLIEMLYRCLILNDSFWSCIRFELIESQSVSLESKNQFVMSESKLISTDGIMKLKGVAFVDRVNSISMCRVLVKFDLHLENLTDECFFKEIWLMNVVF